MPNHVANRLTISGPPQKLTELVASVEGPDVDGNESFFSLHRIIPQPKVYLETEDSSNTMVAVWLVDPDVAHEIDAGQKFRVLFNQGLPIDYFEQARMLHHFKDAPADLDWVGLRAWVQEKHTALIKLGEACVRAYTTHGCHTWYSWRNIFWGTKWDAYDVLREHICTKHTDYIQYDFNTAWNTPRTCIELLIQRFPELTLKHSFFDEGHNFWGSRLYYGGDLEVERATLDEDRVELCIDLLGYDPNEGEDTEKDEE